MEKEISMPWGKLHYSKLGQGIPVMLVHGFGESRGVWNEQIDTLKERHQLLVPDLPGSGKSSLKNHGEISMEFLAEALVQILDKEGIKRVVLIGHSMGGYASLAFVEKYPERLIALGLFHSSALADDGDKKAIRKKGIAFIRKFGARLFLESTIPNLFSNSENPLTGRLKNLAANFRDDDLIGYYEGMIARPDRTSLISSLHIPFLFIMGKNDKAVPLELALKQSHLAPLSVIHILRMSGHMGMWEEKEKSNEILAKFLDQFCGQIENKANKKANLQP